MVFAGIACLGVMSSCGPAHPGVRVLNDLDYSVAINPRCWSKSVSGADPIFISPGDDTVIYPGEPCMIHGPTTRCGPFGAARCEGPYIGCLLVPRDDERDGAPLRVYDVRNDIGWSDCDDSKGVS